MTTTTPTALVEHRDQLLRGLPVTERRLDAAGIPTAVLEGGDGPPVVLLHGPGETAANWRWTIPDLVTTHRVIAPDLPAHGSSGTGDQPLDVDRAVDWLDALVDATCDEAPTVVGHVLGGAIAARFATRRPGRLRSARAGRLTGPRPFPATGPLRHRPVALPGPPPGAELRALHGPVRLRPR